jgi:hypothetical protein
MKKIFILLLIAALAVIASVTYAGPQTVVLTPSNWQDVDQKLEPARFGATGTYPLALLSVVGVVGTSQCSIVLLLANGTVTVSSAAGSNANLSRGIYLIAGYYDGVTGYAYIYNINGWLATLNVPISSGSISFNKKVYGKIIYSGSPAQVMDTVVRILADWRGGGGNRAAWLLFNVTGNQPVSYTIREGTYTVSMAYGGGPPIYMLYVGMTLPLNVTGTGLNQLFSAGAYLIVGSNWYKANYSATAPAPSNNQTGTNTAKLTVTVTPSTYTIQFLLQGALAAQGNGTLSYSFPKNTTVTIRILNGATEVYKTDYKLTQDTTLVYNFGTDNSIYNPSKTCTLELHFFEMSPTGAYRGQIVVDSVQVIGINASITRSAQGVSNVRFTNLPSGHYQIIVQKEGYFETRAWVNLDSDKTLYIGLFKKADTAGTDKPYMGGYVAPQNTTQPFNTIANARNESPPTPTVSGNFYGFHFILVDPTTGQRKSGMVTISAVKRIGKVLWEDTVTVPLATVYVNGSAWWYITEQDVFKALQISGFWEGFGGFKISSGSNTMFVPAESAKNCFYEVVIYYGQAAFGTSSTTYSSGLYDSSGMLAQLMPILVIAMIIGLIGQVLKRK